MEENVITNEEVVIMEEPEIQTTFNETSAEDLIDEEGSVENVSN